MGDDKEEDHEEEGATKKKNEEEASKQETLTRRVRPQGPLQGLHFDDPAEGETRPRNTEKSRGTNVEEVNEAMSSNPGNATAVGLEPQANHKAIVMLVLPMPLSPQSKKR